MKKIEAWAHQWKMSFSPDPDPLKQPEEVKKNKHPPPDIIFNGTNSKKSFYQKHFGMFLDIRHDFAEHIKGIFDKTSKSIGLVRSSEICC